MKKSLDNEFLSKLTSELRKKNDIVDIFYPGDSFERQPVHTVYGGAHLFKSDTALKIQKLANVWVSTYGDNAKDFSEAVGLAHKKGLAEKVFERVQKPLPFTKSSRTNGGDRVWG